MTLKEKLKDRMYYNYNHLEVAEECEKITDEFAIDFINWYAMHGSWIEENLTSKQLLEIFKKEKGL